MILRAHLAIVAAAVLFGSTFVVVKDAVDVVGPLPFLAVRFLSGAAALTPFARRSGHPGMVRAGLWCGAAALVGYLLQTLGLQYTSSSVSAFLTYLLIVIVPVLSALLLRRVPDAPVIGGVALATVGLVLLTGGVDRLGRGEVLTIGCAFAFAVWVLLVSEWSRHYDTAAFTAVQLAVVGVAAFIAALFTDGFDLPARAWVAALYTGIVVSAGALWLQVWGQRRVGANRTALLLMIEPVAAVLFALAVGERIGWQGAAGGALILAGIVVAEAPVARRQAAARS